MSRPVLWQIRSGLRFASCSARQIEVGRFAILEIILVTIRDSQYGRKYRGALAYELNISDNTLDNALDWKQKLLAL